jgi:hypothetical protein
MRLSPDREKRYPLLYSSGYEVSSPETTDYSHPRYNCIAFAADDQTLWWWPDQWGDAYWPPAAPREVTRSAFIKAFETLNYVVCDSGSLEAGYAKIAIYEKSGAPTHAAKQLADGRWTSKLGEWEDIEHSTVEAVQTSGGIGNYGEVAVYMKKPTP